MNNISSVGSEYPNEAKHKETSIFKNSIFWILIICIEYVFLKFPYYTFLGPVMAGCFAYLYFVKKETVLVTFLIVVAHYELKAVLFSTISFPQLLFVFLIYEIITNKKWTVKPKWIVSIVLILIMTFVPWLLGSTKGTDVFYGLVYIFSIIAQFLKYENEKEYLVGKITLSVTTIVSLIAVHALITGGVEYTDVTDLTIARRGILAVGTGDPNFSCLLLCAGIVSALYCKYIYAWLRIILVILMAGAMIGTVSTTGVLGLAIIALVYSITSVKLSSKIRNIIIIVFGVIWLFQLYMALPAEYHSPGIDNYIIRMEEKYVAFVKGDYAEATTNRSNLSERYLDYINKEQSFVKTVFGGNPVVPKSFRNGVISHVTYIDFLLQYGYFGTFLILLYALYKLKKAFDLPVTSQYRRYAISLKTVYLFFAFSISIYRESSFAMLLMALFIL